MTFITKYGKRWVRFSAGQQDADGIAAAPRKGVWIDGVSQEFSKLLKRLKRNRPGLGFYALRHTFETIGGESKDQVAVDAIMGHVDNSMSAVYREEISDQRLRAVTDGIRVWLGCFQRQNKE